MTTNPSTTVAETTNPKNTFTIRVIARGKSMQIDPDQIIRLQANGSYTMIHAEASAPLMTARVLKTYVSPLQGFGFVRVNKTDLVNTNKIARLEDDGRVIMTDEYVSRISRRRKSLFVSLLSVLGLLLTVPVFGQNVGIGTTSPAMPLTVRTADTTAGTPVVSLANGIMDSLYQLNATKGASTGGAGSWMTAIGQAYNGGALTEALKFYRGTGTNNGSIGITTAGAERMRITNNGTVGLGTSSPDTLAKLDVAGKLKLADGTQATGRFLKSDSMGMASWAPITTSTFLSEPVTPDYSCFREVNRTPSLTYPEYIASSQNYVYVLNSGSGTLRTFSLEDPAEPVETSFVDVGFSHNGIAISSDRACIVNGSSNLLHVLSLEDPSHPVFLGAIPTNNFPADVVVSGNLAYVVNYVSSTLQIFDLSIFPGPALIGSINVASLPDKVFISGNYAYITRRNSQTFTIIDISDPFNPVLTFENDLPANYCLDILAHQQYTYALIQDGINYKLRTISLEDPQAPVVVTNLNLNFTPTFMDRVGNHIVVTSLSDNKLVIFSINDPANPSLEAETALPGGPYGITIQHLYAYVGSFITSELVTVKLGCVPTISINSLNGESIATTMWETNGSTIFTNIAKVGIGINTSHAPLQLDNTFDNRKLVLFETNNNDHEFIGFGINPGMLRYQTANAGDDHVFFSGIDSTSSMELMRITGDGLVGIGTTNPHALLQLSNASANRKIVLSETGNNDHQFMGFGNQADMLRYQVNSYAASHVFSAGSGAGASSELMRISGFGFVGIGTNAPTFPLTVRTSASTQGAKVVSLATAIVDTMFQLNVTRGSTTNGVGSWMTAIGQAYNGGTITEGIKFLRGAYTDDGAMAFKTNYTERIRITSSGAIGIGTSIPFSKLDLEGNLTIGAGYSGTVAAPVNGAIIEGNVGIGTDSPHALLQLGNTISNRKMVLYESSNNEHEYLGFGINAGMLRYQVANANDNHVFFSGINSTSSKELMRITGNGDVGIGTTTPHALLQLANTTTNRKLILFETGNNDHQFFGFGNNANSMRYQVASDTNNHVFYSGINSSGSKELMRITGSGFVGIGTNAPTFPLTVRTSYNTEGVIVASLATAITDTMFQLNVSRGSTANGVGSWMTAIGQSYNGGALTEAIKFLRGAYTYDGALAFMTNTEERMRITSSGDIGIGISNPEGPLHVSGNGMTAPDQNRNYFNVSTGPNLIFNNSTSGNVQIIADGYFWANGGGFVATSDQRIKNIKGLTDTKQDLATLNAIEVTNYTYIDSIQNGNTPQKKVIAQQLQSVFPQAVNTNAGIIPNVFEVASSSEVIDQHTIITTSSAHEFVDGDKVRLILEGKGEKVLKVDVIDTMSFRVEEMLSGRIFVYGKHVEDLLNVDYDAVAMLNVSATQELYKMILELKSENEQLRQNLESRLVKVETAQKGGGL